MPLATRCSTWHCCCALCCHAQPCCRTRHSSCHLCWSAQICQPLRHFRRPCWSWQCTATWPSTFRPMQMASSTASCWRHCRRCAGVVTLVAPASLPSLHWRCCPHHTRVTASIALASSPLSPPHHRQNCAGIFALVALAPLPLMCCHRHTSCAGVCPIGTLLVTHHPWQNRLPRLSHCWRHCQHPADIVTGVALTLLSSLR